jgi:nucleotide-binding universal stress UspA family protein
MKTLLVCTDGSAYAPSLYDHALWAARRLGASVHVIHLIEPAPLLPLGGDYSGVMGMEAHAQLTAELLELEKARTRLAEQRGRAVLAAARVHFEAGGLAAGRIRDELLHARLADTTARLASAHDLLLIGKRGEEHAAGARLGENLERIVRTSVHPVFVASRAFQPIVRFLLAYDGGPAAEKAVAHVVESPLLRGLPCHLLAVGVPGEIRESAFLAARDRLAAAGCPVRAEMVPGFPAEVIAETVRREHMSLLLMGAYGHGRLRNFFVGSTTADMLRDCPIPLLLFR